MKNGPGTLFFCSNLRFEISWYDYSKLYHLWEYSLRTFISDLFPSPAQGAGVEGEGRDRKRKKKNHFFIMVAWVAMFRCYLNSDSRVELFGQISCTL